MSKNRKTHKYSLYGKFCPEEYSLSLNLRKSDDRFNAKLQIFGYRASAPSYRIVFNQKNLKISQAKIYQKTADGEVQIKVERIIHHEKREEVRLHTTAKVAAGKYRIELEYVGKINTSGNIGLYRSKVDLGGKETILATQMETHYARMLLPCIDEPEAKATFKVVVGLQGFDKEDEVIFNTSLFSRKSSETSGGVELFDFVRTPRMSSYLLALSVGKFLKVKREIELGSGKVTVSAMCVKSGGRSAEQLEFAVDFATRVMPLLEEAFKTPYELDKLDLLAVPDFNDGGMENWGLLIFKEELLLFDEGKATLMDKQSIAQTIAHEIAHQWFGNLVTMKWWDELWLNEGFAAFMEYWVIDKLYPGWSATEAYMMLDKPYGMRMDAVRESRPVMRKVERAQLAEQTFDGIAYEKSAGIIRMVFDLIGEEKFFGGLVHYFSKHKYGSVSYLDLIKCWNDGLDFDLQDFVESWIDKPGFPVISLEKFNKNGRSGVVLRQKRFLIDAGDDDLDEDILNAAKNIYSKNGKKQMEYYKNNLSKDGRKKINTPSNWKVPIKYKTASGGDGQIIFNKTKYTLYAKSEDDLPIFYNNGGTGMYLVAYDKASISNIKLALDSNKLSVADKINLLNDIIMLVKALEFEPGVVAALDVILEVLESTDLELTDAKLPQGESYLWGLAGGFFGFVNAHLIQDNQKSAEALVKMVSKIVGAKILDLGVDGMKDEPAEVTEARFEVFSIIALLGLKPYSERLNIIFDLAKVETEKYGLKSLFNYITPEKRILVLYSIAQRGDIEDYNLLRDFYNLTKDDSLISDDVQYGLANFKGEKFVQINIKFMTDQNLIRLQDVASFFANLCSGKVSQHQALDQWFMEYGWSWMCEVLDDSEKISCLQSWLGRIYTTEQMSRHTNFLNKYYADKKIEKEGLGFVIAEALNIAKSRILWQSKGVYDFKGSL